MIIDSHTHIDITLESAPELKETLFINARENGVAAMVQIGAHRNSYEYSRNLSHSPTPVPVFYTIGMHPGEAHELEPSAGIHFARENKTDPRFIGIGEIGLEYYYAKEHAQIQKKVFREYLDLASELGKPVVIHTRDAFEDTLSLLEPYQNDINILIHCFTGDRAQMEEYANRGFYISFSGILTFKNAKVIQEAALHAPLDKILIETDAPFLTPSPMRGKTNQPAYLRHTFEYLAKLRNLPADELSLTLMENTQAFYGIRFFS